MTSYIYKLFTLFIFIVFSFSINSLAGDYKISGASLTQKSGSNSFNRPLFANAGAFTIWAGDKPNIGFSNPQLLGEMYLGILNGNQSKWLTQADSIKTIYNGKSIVYIIKDKIIGGGVITIEVIPDNVNMAGALVRVQSNLISRNVKLVFGYKGGNGVILPTDSVYNYKNLNEVHEYVTNNNQFTFKLFGSEKDSCVDQKAFHLFGYSSLPLNYKIVHQRYFNNLSKADTAIHTNPNGDSLMLLGSVVFAFNPNIYFYLTNKPFDDVKKLDKFYSASLKNSAQNKFTIDAPDSVINLFTAMLPMSRINVAFLPVDALITGANPDQAIPYFNHWLDVTLKDSMLNNEMDYVTVIHQITQYLQWSNDGITAAALKEKINTAFSNDKILEGLTILGKFPYSLPNNNEGVSYVSQSLINDLNQLHRLFPQIFNSINNTSGKAFVSDKNGKLISFLLDNANSQTNFDLKSLNYALLDGNLQILTRANLLESVPYHFNYVYGIDSNNIYQTSDWQPINKKYSLYNYSDNYNYAANLWYFGKTQTAFTHWKSITKTMLSTDFVPGLFKMNFAHLDYSLKNESVMDDPQSIESGLSSLITGLVGYNPIGDTLQFEPNLPDDWNNFSFSSNQFNCIYKKKGAIAHFALTLKSSVALKLILKNSKYIKELKINGNIIPFEYQSDGVYLPTAIALLNANNQFDIEIKYDAKNTFINDILPVDTLNNRKNEIFVSLPKQFIFNELKDPFKVIKSNILDSGKLKQTISFPEAGYFSTFIKTTDQGVNRWILKGYYNPKKDKENKLKLSTQLVQPINIYSFFNGKVNDFHLSVRKEPNLPINNISDYGMRTAAGRQSLLLLKEGYKFRTPFDPGTNNVAFFQKNTKGIPDSLQISLDGNLGQFVSLLIANTGNPIFYKMPILKVSINYIDGSESTKYLDIPNSLWPIEQDLINIEQPPIRLSLKDGNTYSPIIDKNQYIENPFSNNKFLINGAANIINIAINPRKRLKYIQISPLVPDIKFGLMGISILKDIAQVAESVEKGPESVFQYLSSTNTDSTVFWDFLVNNGRKSNYWAAIPVPSVWEQNGYGNYNYGLDAATYGPNFPIGNEIGSYRLNFNLKNLKSKRVLLHFDGAFTDTKVTLNDKKALTHKGGYYPFSFDVTSLVTEGSNKLNIEVAKQSSDKNINEVERNNTAWIFGGIYRPVYLEILPENYFSDLKIKTAAGGNINVQLSPKGILANEEINITVQDDAGNILGKINKNIGLTDSLINVNTQIDDVSNWSTESPNLYNLVVSVLIDHKTVYQSTKRIGFRSVEIKSDNGIYINGKSIKIKGINRADLWPDNGPSISENQLITDALLVKSMNMNTINIDGPVSERFLTICDSLGIMLIETLPGEKTQYNLDNAIAFIKELTNFSQNHPSVIYWQTNAYDYKLDSLFKRFDLSERNVIHLGYAYNSLNILKEPTFEQWIDTLQNGKSNLPIFVLNGANDGGGAAGLKKWWNVVLNTKNAAGLILGQLSDRGLLRTDQDGRIDVNKPGLGNGIVGPFREKEASYYGIKEIFSPVDIIENQITESFNGTLNVINKYAFTDLKDCVFSTEWINYPTPNQPQSGYIIAFKNYEHTNSIMPNDTGILPITIPANGFKNYDALIVRVYDPISTREIFQWTLPLNNRETIVQNIVNQKGTSSISLEEDSTDYVLKSGQITVYINKRSGLLDHANHFSDYHLNSGPIPIHGTLILTNIQAKRTNNSIKVSANYLGNIKSINWELMDNGWLKLDYQYQMDTFNNTNGISFNYPEGKVIAAKWLGLGPFRIWNDRKDGMSENVWENYYNSTITGKSPWKYPEFKGYFGDITWMQLNTNQGFITMVTPDQDMSVKLFKFPGIDGLQIYPPSPTGDISFLDKIPNVNYQTTNGKIISSKKLYNLFKPGIKSHTIYFYFGLLE